MTREFIVGMTGASGARVGLALVRALQRQDSVSRIHLVLSDAALPVISHELAASGLSPSALVERFLDADRRVVPYRNDQIAAPIASGSYRVAGMVIAPCSMNTLAGIAAGLSPHLMGRAADVTLKERRPLLLAIRETPLGLTHIENMARVTRAGAVVFPVCPAYYAEPATPAEIDDNFVMRLLDHLGLPADRGRRWGTPPGDG